MLKATTPKFNLVHALREIAAKNKKRQADVVRATEFNHVFVSRVFNGTQPNVSAVDLEKISDVLCETDEERAELLRNYLLDSMGDVKGSDLVKILTSGEEDFRRSLPSKKKPLDPELRSALDKITELSRESLEVAEVIKQLARSYERFKGG